MRSVLDCYPSFSASVPPYTASKLGILDTNLRPTLLGRPTQSAGFEILFIVPVYGMAFMWRCMLMMETVVETVTYLHIYQWLYLPCTRQAGELQTLYGC